MKLQSLYILYNIREDTAMNKLSVGIKKELSLYHTYYRKLTGNTSTIKH